MKISKVFALTAFLVIAALGCEPYKKPRIGYPPSDSSVTADAAPVADAAVKDTAALASDADTASMPDVAADILSDRADTAALPDVVLAGDTAILVDAPAPNDVMALLDTVPDIGPDKPCINPLPGHYTARLDPALSSDGNSISRLGSYGFTIGVDATGQFMLDATYDGWAHYGFPVVCGSFDAKHGQGWDGLGGTNCPTDGFGLVGSFVSPTEARGLYKGLAWRCQETSSGYFIATLDPGPDAAPPDTAAIDLAAVDSGASSDR